MTTEMHRITPACLPADPGVSALLAKIAPMMDKIPGLEGFEMTFLFDDDMRTPLAEMVLAVRTQLEDGPGIYMTQWSEKLDTYLPAAQVFRLQTAVLRGVPMAVALERVGRSCLNDYMRKTPLRVFFTRDAVFVSAAEPLRLLMNMPDDLPDWHRQMILSILPRDPRSNHDRLELITRLEASYAIWSDAYSDQNARAMRSYKVEVVQPDRAEMEASIKV